jgi:endoglucanase
MGERLRHMRAVIDISRNGNGPYVSDNQDGPDWCNPPGRKLGAYPVLAPWGQSLAGYPGVAGLLRIKDPWISDGSCRRTENGQMEPPAGAAYPAYTIGLAQGGSP